MSEKFVVENECGYYPNDNKKEDWQDDYRTKVYISEPGWYWAGLKKNEGGGNRPPLVSKLRKMTQEMVQKYCHDIKILTKEQAKEKFSKADSGSSRSRGDSEIDNDIPF
jgi:hypothetical protein